MRNQLVIQFLTTDGADLDALFEVEEAFFQLFSQSNYGVVDGHDVGQGRFNLFVFIKGAWGPVIERATALLKHRNMLNRCVIAKGLGRSERYQVIWPENFAGKFEL